jgi:hypothetical protein
MLSKTSTVWYLRDSSDLLQIRNRISEECLGPFNKLGSISHEATRAYSRRTPESSGVIPGPVQFNRQNKPRSYRGLFKTIGSIYREHGGPFKSIGSNRKNAAWARSIKSAASARKLFQAYSRPSAALKKAQPGPFHGNRRNYQGCYPGPFNKIGSIS